MCNEHSLPVVEVTILLFKIKACVTLHKREFIPKCDIGQRKFMNSFVE